MKARSTRTHHMGRSNREANSLPRTGNDLFERSFTRSQSQYHPKSNKIATAASHRNNVDANKAYISTNMNQTMFPTFGKSNPPSSSHGNILTMQSVASKGHHFEFESKRFDQNNIRPFKHKKHTPLMMHPPLDLSNKLNRTVSNIRDEIVNQSHIDSAKVNLHKLSELKQTFLRNNAKRKNLTEYFHRFSDNQQKMSGDGVRKLVKEYGYDINDDEINLMFKLNGIHRTNSTKSQNQELAFDLPAFINLMTKENVYFNTLKLPDPEKQSESNQNYRFKAPEFEVFRNKFKKLKEAFSVDKNSPIDFIRYEKVMKKLDINDLVVKESQRKQIYDRFATENGFLNVERLLGAIVTQENQRVQKSGRGLMLSHTDSFSENIKANEQFKNEKNAYENAAQQLTDLKKCSFTEYETRVSEVRALKREIKNIKDKEGIDIVGELCDHGRQTSKPRLRENLQLFLQKRGFNFNKSEYVSFMAYLDFDAQNKISQGGLKERIFNENDQAIVQRIDRRKRRPEPQSQRNPQRVNQFDQRAAEETITKYKLLKMHPSISEIFNTFDRDKDGFVSKKELIETMQGITDFRKEEIENLANFIDSSGKEYVSYSEFRKKISPDSHSKTSKNIGSEEVFEPADKLFKLRSKSSISWTAQKNQRVNEENQPEEQMVTKFAAWPNSKYAADFTLIQPPSKCGMSTDEYQRFNTASKHSLGLEEKMQKQRVHEQRLRKTAQWQQIIANRQESRQRQEEKHNLSKGYNLRLLKEQYEARCHANSVIA